MTEELYNKIDKFCNETDWSKYPTYEHALEEFIKGIVAEGTKELKAQIEKMKSALIDIKTNTDDVNIEWQIKYLFDELEIKEK